MIKTFLIIGLGSDWPEFLQSLEVTRFQEYSDMDGALSCWCGSAEEALCFVDTKSARQAKELYPFATVLIYQATHPNGEVLVDMGTYFSAQLLTSLLAPL
jgi:hypothetical protein